MSVVLHIDMNSYFASVEQQANPRLRGKPIGITGGDRTSRTVLSTASIEAKKLGIKTGMQIWEAKKICPQIIIVSGDADKYLSCTQKFLNIFKDYTPYLEVFSIDEAFLELPPYVIPVKTGIHLITSDLELDPRPLKRTFGLREDDRVIQIAHEIKQKIKSQLGEYITCSVGISYNKLMAKLAGSLKKPDGLVVIPDTDTAIKILDQAQLDDICGIGPGIKKRLFNMGIRDFSGLRKVPEELLVASFKSYGKVLYDMARGVDYNPIVPFFNKGEVKSIGHRHTISHDTDDLGEIKQILLKMSEMVAGRLRHKELVGKTIHCYYRSSLHLSGVSGGPSDHLEGVFRGSGMQKTLSSFSQDGLEIFQAAWQIFQQVWTGEKIRMVGVSVSSLKPSKPANLSWLPDEQKRDVILQAIDKVNNKFGDFTIQRAVLLDSCSIKRKPNPFLSDRRFKI